MDGYEYDTEIRVFLETIWLWISTTILFSRSSEAEATASTEASANVRYGYYGYGFRPYNYGYYGLYDYLRPHGYGYYGKRSVRTSADSSEAFHEDGAKTKTGGRVERKM